MGYKIVKKPTVWWPVKIDVAVDDGEVVTMTFDLRFRRMKADELQALLPDLEKARQAEIAAGVNISSGEKAPDLALIWAELVAMLATDWRHVTADNDEPLRWDVPEGWLTELDEKGQRKPLDAPNLVALLREAGMFTAIYIAFQDCMAARADIRAGN